MTETLTVRELNRATLARQLLLERSELGAVEAIGHLGGLQMQEPRAPFVALWSRLEQSGAESVRAAFQDRSLVRATLWRGTLHAVRTEDFVAWRLPFQPVLDRALRGLRIRVEDLDTDAIVDLTRSLLDEKPRTMTALRPHLVACWPDVDPSHLTHVARSLLPLVQLPTDHRWAFPGLAAFTPASTWLDQPLGSEDTRPDMIRRYLAAYGPATAADIATWSGLQGVRTILAGMRDELIELSDETGRALVDLPDAPRPPGDEPAPVRMLAEFDNVLLSHADRTRILAAEHRSAVMTVNGRVRGTFTVDGFVAGLWFARGDGVVVRPFEPLTRPETDELMAEADALASFLAPDLQPPAR